jgi:hypothetical protein
MAKEAFPMCGRTILDTGGGTKSIDVPGAQAGDLVICTMESDDTGTPITKLTAVAAANIITFVRTDDGSSNDDAVIQWLLVRPSPTVVPKPG